MTPGPGFRRYLQRIFWTSERSGAMANKLIRMALAVLVASRHRRLEQNHPADSVDRKSGEAKRPETRQPGRIKDERE
jgi:hypothetical protein